MVVLSRREIGQPALGGSGRLLPGSLVRFGNLALHVEMDLRHRPARFEFLEGHRRRRLQLVGHQSDASKLPRQRHRETAGMGGGHELFGIRSLSVAESRLERIGGVAQRATLNR